MTSIFFKKLIIIIRFALRNITLTRFANGFMNYSPTNWNGFGWKHEREWEKYLTKIITFTPMETWTILLIKRPVLIQKLVFNFGTLTSIKKLQINPNLGGLFRGSFWGGRGVKLPPPPCLKLFRIMVETSNLAGKYTPISSFRKYTF